MLSSKLHRHLRALPALAGMRESAEARLSPPMPSSRICTVEFGNRASFGHHARIATERRDAHRFAIPAPAVPSTPGSTWSAERGSFRFLDSALPAFAFPQLDSSDWAEQIEHPTFSPRFPTFLQSRENYVRCGCRKSSRRVNCPNNARASGEIGRRASFRS